jgi:hypothetical protein
VQVINNFINEGFHGSVDVTVGLLVVTSEGGGSVLLQNVGVYLMMSVHRDHQ